MHLDRCRSIRVVPPGRSPFHLIPLNGPLRSDGEIRFGPLHGRNGPPTIGRDPT